MKRAHDQHSRVFGTEVRHQRGIYVGIAGYGRVDDLPIDRMPNEARCEHRRDAFIVMRRARLRG